LSTLAAIAVLLVAMVTNTRFFTPEQAKALNPPPFSPEQYAKDNWLFAVEGVAGAGARRSLDEG
jgi:hypothetical protein